MIVLKRLATVGAALAMAGGLVLSSEAAASAASPPAAVTGPASQVGVATATLSGDVDPNGSATSWYFEYGTTTGYGQTTGSESAGSGNTTVGISKEVSGLTPGTTYHYRLVATDPSGSVYGGDETVRTAELPPAILVQHAVGATDTTVKVEANIDANGLSSTWVVRYGIGSLATESAVHTVGSSDSTVTVTMTVDGLSPGRQYDFDVVATNAAGSNTSPESTLDTTGPPVVVSSQAGDVTPSTVKFGADVDPSGHPTTWYFEYGTTTALVSATAAIKHSASFSTVALSSEVGGLQANTTYYYRVVAVNSSGTVYGPTETFMTPGPTIASSGNPEVFGHSVTLSGTIPDAVAGQTVLLYATPVGGDETTEVADLLTTTNGAWSEVIQPAVSTEYHVVWNGEPSLNLDEQVAPSVTFGWQARAGTVTTHVADDRRLGRTLVRLQRDVKGVWRTVETTRIDRRGYAVFHPGLPKGRSALRVCFTAFQAGPGYVAGYSNVHVVRVG